MRLPLALLLALLPLATLPGCVVKTVADVATAPVRVGGKAVDMATTSQSEADEKRGRAMREREERLGRLDKQYREARRDCDKGKSRACDRADELADRIRRERSAYP
ncbi:MAG: hypothetical protein M0R03_00800 [Novosphingobium sp.]|nr:hypothetical protein [Novosphingobium sp.]